MNGLYQAMSAVIDCSRDDCILHGQLLADYVAQLVKSEKQMNREELEEREQDPEYRAEHEKDCQHDR